MSVIVGTQKNRRNSHETVGVGVELRGPPQADGWVGAVKSTLYGREVPHSATGGCHFSASGGLREYRRNPVSWHGAGSGLGRLGRSAAAAGVGQRGRSASGRGGWWPPCRGTGPALTGGQAEYWRRKALREGLRHLQTGQARFKTIRPRRTAGTAEPRVPATGKDGNGVVAPQPRIKYGAGFIDTAPKARPH